MKKDNDLHHLASLVPTQFIAGRARLAGWFTANPGSYAAASRPRRTQRHVARTSPTGCSSYIPGVYAGPRASHRESVCNAGQGGIGREEGQACSALMGGTTRLLEAMMT